MSIHQRARWACAMAVLACATVAGVGQASPRATTIERMREIEALGSSGELESWINGGHHQAVAEGENVEFHFRAARKGHLLAIYLDSEGGLLVARPTPASDHGRVEPGREVVFPSDQPIELRASPPLGHETLFAILTPEPVSLAGLLPEGDELDDVVTLPAEQGAAFLEKLRGRLQQAGPLSIATFEHRVVADAESHPWLESEVIERRLGDRTRALRPPRVELDVRFEFDSAELTDAARAQLDEAGAALQRLPDREFQLSGHTDAKGPEDYNLDLSRERAQAAVEYLVQKWDIDPARLRAMGFGESRPFRAAHGEVQDPLNRRVEIEAR